MTHNGTQNTENTEHVLCNGQHQQNKPKRKKSDKQRPVTIGDAHKRFKIFVRRCKSKNPTVEMMREHFVYGKKIWEYHNSTGNKKEFNPGTKVHWNKNSGLEEDQWMNVDPNNFIMTKKGKRKRPTSIELLPVAQKWIEWYEDTFGVVEPQEEGNVSVQMENKAPSGSINVSSAQSAHGHLGSLSSSAPAATSTSLDVFMCSNYKASRGKESKVNGARQATAPYPSGQYGRSADVKERLKNKVQNRTSAVAIPTVPRYTLMNAGSPAENMGDAEIYGSAPAETINITVNMTHGYGSAPVVTGTDNMIDGYGSVHSETGTASMADEYGSAAVVTGTASMTDEYGSAAVVTGTDNMIDGYGSAPSEIGTASMADEYGSVHSETGTASMADEYGSVHSETGAASMADVYGSTPSETGTASMADVYGSAPSETGTASMTEHCADMTSSSPINLVGMETTSEALISLLQPAQQNKLSAGNINDDLAFGNDYRKSVEDTFSTVCPSTAMNVFGGTNIAVLAPTLVLSDDQRETLDREMDNSVNQEYFIDLASSSFQRILSETRDSENGAPTPLLVDKQKQGTLTNHGTYSSVCTQPSAWMTGSGNPMLCGTDQFQTLETNNMLDEEDATMFEGDIYQRYYNGSDTVQPGLGDLSYDLKDLDVDFEQW